MSSSAPAHVVLESFCSSYGVRFHLKKSDFVRLVFEKNIPTADLSSARSSIFSAAQSLGLADKRADIVNRRGTSLNPLKKKLAEDVWDLAQCVSSRTCVKRVMIRNGKRGLSYIESKHGAGTNDNGKTEVPVSSSITPSQSQCENKAVGHSSTYAQASSTIPGSQSYCQLNKPTSQHCVTVSRCVSNNTPIIEVTNTSTAAVSTGHTPRVSTSITNHTHCVNPSNTTASRCVSNNSNVTSSVDGTEMSEIVMETSIASKPSNSNSSQSQINHPEHKFDDSSIGLQVQQLHKSLSDIKSAMKRLEGLINRPVYHCHVYVVTKESPYPTTHVKSSLERLLTCRVEAAHLVRASGNSAYKVKVDKDDLQRALSSCHTTNAHHKVRLWKSSTRHLSSQSSSIGDRVMCTSHDELRISSWNCRGFNCSEAYLKHLSHQSDIILLQEHWLWPFQLQKLSSAIDGFSAFGVSDSRLCETSNLHRGCGGVAFLWRKSLSVTPVTLNVGSDRLCATELPLTCGRVERIIIFNVYAPSSDAEILEFNDCIHSLEEEINRVDHNTTAVVIAGDFNAHLGTLAGPRGSGSPNQRGFALKEFIDRNKLFVASHSSLSSGPSFTYHSGRYYSTIDYIIVNGPCSGLLASCKGLPDHPLNVSDHVPLTLSLKAVTEEANTQTTPTKRIHWEKAVNTGAVLDFAKCVDECTRKHLNAHLGDVEELDKEVQAVCESVLGISNSILPLKTGGNKGSRKFFNDSQLRQLCKTSKTSWSEWSKAGRPESGPLLEKKNADKRNVRMKLNQLQARKDRSHIETIDRMFKTKDKKRFHAPKQSPSGTRLLVDNNIITNSTDVSTAWATHFEQLGSSRIAENQVLQELQSKVLSYQSRSLHNEDYILDTDIEVTEIDAAIANLKKGKSAGPDGILPEHIIYSGPIFKLWLKKIYNYIIQCETIPSYLSSAILVPIYKGKGRNPLMTTSYRGISLTSVIVKLFEYILLQRMTPILSDRGIPHYTQTAFQKGISCADPTEVVQEAVRDYIEDGSTIYQCFYDLEKAFDSVEFCVLLHHLYESGINGKAWRVIRSFYSEPTAQVRVGKQLSRVIQLKRGVRQGSVLSPTLFLLVMDSLLTTLADAEEGVSIRGIYAGSLCHADDLRSVTPSLLSLEKQVKIIQSFTSANSLTLNFNKLDLLAMSRAQNPPECILDVQQSEISSSATATCLGVVWSHNLSPKASIENNINKARRAFFGLGSLGVYHGKVNPLTASEAVQACVMPVCLYGSENWLLTGPMLLTLEAFQAELGKRILKLPKHFANLCPLVFLDWPTMRYRILIQKLSFLYRLIHSCKSTISVKVFNSLKDQAPGPLIVQQCKLLEEVYDTNITESILEGDEISLKSIKKVLRAADSDYVWSKVSQQTSLRVLPRDISWPKLWDIARERGIQGARSLSVIMRVLATPFQENSKCPLCDSELPRDSVFADHISVVHLSRSLPNILSLLTTYDDHLFSVGSELKRLYAAQNSVP